MFVRRKKNSSGSFSVQIIQKVGRINKVVKSIGSSFDETELDILERQAKLEIERIQGQTFLFSNDRDSSLKSILSNVVNNEIELVGPDYILGRIYESMGYHKIGIDDLFRDLVMSRLVYPGSKLKTVDYLSRFKNKEVSVYSIYRYMDKIHKEFKEDVERITFNHFEKILGGHIGIVFYDVTTLYFEAPDEDDLRKIGYSKDGKHQHPQIKLGLLVGPQGYPLGYDIFEGSTYEGYTLIPVLENIQKKFSIGKPIVIADAGLLSSANIKALISHGYRFVLGGKIRNESKEIKDAIQKLEITEDNPGEVKKDGYRLVVSFSEKRLKKDAHNRKKGLEKLEKKVKNGKIDKSSINNRGYNKYLKLESEIKVAIDYTKYQLDARWDGLKGYLTNTDMKSKEVIAAYGNLWQIEKAFRISKTDIRIRPIYHRIPERIQTHICICFVSYAVFKELERLLKNRKVSFSANRAIELTKNMYQIRVFLPDSKTYTTVPLKPTQEQQELISAIMKN
ncbi:IS1634 family transposase [Cognataquiflexum rubidum]|uniref:IS1634 family transposase n=1 Tax=Cognataquiflexum rubidum TaxID=2922273 RepID=UPI001F13FF20|nr:IS1634 family transposase [Cognataquiflexum rubidum]MCH6236828.1 IS1634 family transposase [Cognataquiflexum rubidum]